MALAQKKSAFELYEIPEGKMGISHSSKEFSTGYMEITPGRELAKHNRPVWEHLMQIRGSIEIKLFEGDLSRTVKLNENDTLDIPPLQFHIHSNINGSESSLTMWKADGDITEIIDNIRKNKRLR
jgi:mannose-6-phosphate isomerase-like protein (cupin superfamily)